MIRPDNATEYPDIDLKLGIKSSLPNVKATLALLILLWRVSNKTSTLEYCEEEENGVKLTDDLTSKLHVLLRTECDESVCPFDTFDGLIKNNQMLKSQLEALIVAFELVWKLAKIRFSDEKKPSSAERTGGKRFAKRLSFTINMDLLDVLFQNETDEYTKVLFKWLGVNVEANPEYELSLLRILTVFSESAVYKLSDGDKEVVFNLKSLYSKLITSAAEVDINGDNEAKGPLRVLKSSLSEKMNPFLGYKDGRVSLTSDGYDIKHYSERVDAYLSLSTSKIKGYQDATEELAAISDEADVSEYDFAAKIIRDYISETGYEFDVSEADLSSLYSDFNERFSPDKLTAIPDDELLKTVFYTADSTNDSLCYWLEFHTQNKKCFGSIAGGSSFKFGLFQKKDEGTWITGSPTKPEELTPEQALQVGRDIRDIIVKGAAIIKSYGAVDSLDVYEKMDDELSAVLGKYGQLQWIHKYYCMVFPSLFATWHSYDWQYHILYAYGIKPSGKYYARSGQLSMIANRAKLSGPTFAHASFDKFGNIKKFCRLGTTEGTSGESLFPTWRTEKIAAIGWNGLGSLSDYQMDGDLVKKAVAEKLGELYYQKDARTASRKAGELVTFFKTNSDTVFVAMNGEQLLSLGDEIGAYYFDESQVFAHCKSVAWHDCFQSDEKLPQKSEAILTSCHDLSAEENLLFLYHKYYYEISDEGAIEMNEEEKEIAMTPRVNPLHPLNQIIYGAPGTGKTYSSIEYAMAIIENRPVDLTAQTREQRQALMAKYSEAVTAGHVVFTTFHQSYGYEEFVQGIRPDAKAGNISFKKVNGVFKTIADTAKLDPGNNYVIIIDEINRGNISKIFGELITLIEEDKRCGELNQLTVTLPMGEKFSVPNNLYIIGTMNSADKSISLIDTALRRRFGFVEMAPNESLIDDFVLRGVLVALNTYIRKELRSTDLLIGHAYFIGKSADDLDSIMNNSIIPLLYEYFYDDEAKVKKALDCLADTDFVIDTAYRGRIRITKKG